MGRMCVTEHQNWLEQFWGRPGPTQGCGFDDNETFDHGRFEIYHWSALFKICLVRRQEKWVFFFYFPVPARYIRQNLYWGDGKNSRRYSRPHLPEQLCCTSSIFSISFHSSSPAIFNLWDARGQQERRGSLKEGKALFETQYIFRKTLQIFKAKVHNWEPYH
jgi:hypothetical protein